MTELPAPYDATRDEEAFKQAERESKERDRQDKEVLMALLSTPKGRNWLWRFFEKTHMISTSFSPDAMTMAFREGERNIGLQLWAQATEAAPDLMISMVRERGKANG